MSSNKVENKVEKTPSGRKVALEAMRAALPFRNEIGNTNFRKLLLEQLRLIYNKGSVPVMYNYAMDTVIANKESEPFGKKNGDKLVKVELTEEQRDNVVGAIASAIAMVVRDEEIVLKVGLTWRVYNKKSGDTVSYALNKKQAYALRDGDKTLSCKAIAA